MDISNALNQETILEGLNEVFFESYNEELPPDYATLEDVFMTKSSRKAAEFDLDLRGTSQFSEKGESEDIYEDIMKEKYKTTYTNVTFASSVPITREYIEDELYDIVSDLVTDLGDSARETQYNKSFSVYRNGHNASFLGADGKSLFATDHPRDFGGTLNNKLTEKFKASVLEEMISRLTTQVSHSNKIITNLPDILLVPPKRYAQAVQITDAKLVPGSNNNEPNVVSTKYSVRVKQSPYLDSIAGGNDDAVYLLSKKHRIKRFIRVPLQTWMMPWNQSQKTVTKYCARYRESAGWSSPVGVISTDGTTGSY